VSALEQFELDGSPCCPHCQFHGDGDEDTWQQAKTAAFDRHLKMFL